MAARDIKVRHSAYGTYEFLTEANVEVGLAEGDVVKRGGTGGNYAAIIADGDPEAGTDIVLGVTKNGSSNTTAANGVVNVELVGPGSIISGRAAPAANVNTAAKLLAIRSDFVAF